MSCTRPNCIHVMTSGTPASIAVDSPPLQAQTPATRGVSKPACRKQSTIQSDTKQANCGADRFRPTPLRFLRGHSEGHRLQRRSGCWRLVHAGCTQLLQLINKVMVWAH